MATSRVKGKPATSTARTKSSTRPAAATSKSARATTAKSASSKSANTRTTPQSRQVAAVNRGTSAYGHAFWSRAGILSGLALGILILVQINADRPEDPAGSQYRSTYPPAYTGNHDETVPRHNRVYTYPPAGFTWHPAAPGYYAPPTPAPGYGYHPYYGPWSPSRNMPTPGYWKHPDRKG